MVFGAFDGLHAGHKEMLKEAKALGEHLVTVVAQDAIVRQLKGGEPKLNIAERIADLQELDGVDEVVAGDADMSTWEVVKRHRPGVIAIGHDQDTLKEDLEKHIDELGYTPQLVQLKHYEVNKE